MPCSAEIDPPSDDDDIVHGARHVGSHSAMKSSRAIPGGCETIVVHVAVAEVAERDGPCPGTNALDDELGGLR